MAIRSASRGSQRWNWREWAHAYALEDEGVRSAIRHGRLHALVGIAFGKLREVLAEFGIERGGRFDFCWNEFSPGVFDQIDLDTIGVSVEIEVGTLSCIIRIYAIREVHFPYCIERAAALCKAGSQLP